jgi:hypothetical protein
MCAGRIPGMGRGADDWDNLLAGDASGYSRHRKPRFVIAAPAK